MENEPLTEVRKREEKRLKQVEERFISGRLREWKREEKIKSIQAAITA